MLVRRFLNSSVSFWQKGILKVDSASVRHVGGTCMVYFRPDLVQNLRQGAIWRLEWQGAPTPSVTRQGQ